MADSDNQTDWDQPISSFGAGLDLVSDDVSPGEGAELESLPEGGFEYVEGYQPPQPPARSEFTPQALGQAFTLADETTQLRDIGEASFGWPSAAPEVVHGADDRFRITNTKSYPWRAHASLRITAADGSAWIGTGWFVGPNLLVTAGHCVYINSGVPERDGFVKRIVVMPGRDGSTLPYGSATSTRFWSVVGWSQHRNGEYDYGAIVLDQPLGAATGWLGFGSWADLDGVAGNISGYPGDKPAGTQWYAGRRIDSTTARKVFYDIDTAGGQSGSAVYRFWNGGRYGIAVHAYGGGSVNSGTRINARVFANLKMWKEASQS